MFWTSVSITFINISYIQNYLLHNIYNNFFLSQAFKDSIKRCICFFCVSQLWERTLGRIFNTTSHIHQPLIPPKLMCFEYFIYHVGRQAGLSATSVLLNSNVVASNTKKNTFSQPKWYPSKLKSQLRGVENCFNRTLCGGLHKVRTPQPHAHNVLNGNTRG